MRKVWIVAVREYLAAVRTKAFLIGIILMPIMMGGGFIAQALVGDQVDLRPKHFAVIDRSPDQLIYPELKKVAEVQNQLVAEPGKIKAKMAPFHLEQATVAADTNLPQLRYELSERVRNGELDGFLEIGPEVLQPPPLTVAFKALMRREEDDETQGEDMTALEPYALRYQTNRPSYLDFPKWAEKIVSSTVQGQRALRAGVKPAAVVKIVQPVPLFSKGLTTRDPVTGEIRDARDQNPIVALLLPGFLLVLMFMMVLLGATPLLQGVIEEKMQRIAEVLLGSVPPFQLMLGKILGMVGVSLTMTAVYLSGAYAALQYFGYAEYLPGEIIVWFLIYQVLAVFMFGSLYAAVGAACTDMKEAQTMMMPVTLVIMMPMFIWINVVREPTSAFSTIASLFPPATPMLMIARLGVPPGIPLWQPLLGVVLVLVTTIVCVWAAGRIFRVGILMQGKAPRVGELLRWVVRG
jgi:ABC-2 type transport system permease protein